MVSQVTSSLTQHFSGHEKTIFALAKLDIESARSIDSRVVVRKPNDGIDTVTHSRERRRTGATVR